VLEMLTFPVLPYSLAGIKSLIAKSLNASMRARWQLCFRFDKERPLTVRTLTTPDGSY
jgi:hypothetical protein